jgi:hypothetical protein
MPSLKNAKKMELVSTETPMSGFDVLAGLTGNQASVDPVRPTSVLNTTSGVAGGSIRPASSFKVAPLEEAQPLGIRSVEVFNAFPIIAGALVEVATTPAVPFPATSHKQALMLDSEAASAIGILTGRSLHVEAILEKKPQVIPVPRADEDLPFAEEIRPPWYRRLIDSARASLQKLAKRLSRPKPDVISHLPPDHEPPGIKVRPVVPGPKLFVDSDGHISVVGLKGIAASSGNSVGHPLKNLNTPLLVELLQRFESQLPTAPEAMKGLRGAPNPGEWRALSPAEAIAAISSLLK